MTYTKFLTTTANLAQVSQIIAFIPSLAEWAKAEGREWAKAREQWANIIEKASCPISAAAAGKEIYELLIAAE
jgi:hypothetical protein